MWQCFRIPRNLSKKQLQQEGYLLIFRAPYSVGHVWNKKKNINLQIIICLNSGPVICDSSTRTAALLVF